MKFGKKFLLLAIVAIGYGGFLKYTSSYPFVKNDAEFFNQSYSYNLDQMQKACEDMSRWSYVAGLSEGAFNVPLPHGKTYYYKSRCFMELAKKQMDEKLCSNAKKRWSLLYDGSSVSQEACVKEVRRLAETNRSQQQSNANTQEIKAKAMKIVEVVVERMSAGKWSIRITFSGDLSGDYKLEFINGAAEFSDPSRVFRSEDISLEKGSTTITRVVEGTQLTVCKGCEMYPKRIYPFAAGLTLMKVKDAQSPSSPLLVSLWNTNIRTD